MSEIFKAKVIEYAQKHSIDVTELQNTYEAAKLIGIKFDYTNFESKIIGLYHLFRYIKSNDD